VFAFKFATNVEELTKNGDVPVAAVEANLLAVILQVFALIFLLIKVPVNVPPANGRKLLEKSDAYLPPNNAELLA